VVAAGETLVRVVVVPAVRERRGRRGRARRAGRELAHAHVSSSLAHDEALGRVRPLRDEVLRAAVDAAAELVAEVGAVLEVGEVELVLRDELEGPRRLGRLARLRRRHGLHGDVRVLARGEVGRAEPAAVDLLQRVHGLGVHHRRR